jgi:Flp pilus assembly protein TadD
MTSMERNGVNATPAQPRPHSKGAGQGRLISTVLLILAAGLWAYHNSFTGVFLFDDDVEIAENPALHRLWPPWALLGRSIRPLTDLSFALNYALVGLDVQGYHIVNLAIHLAAALVLFGLLRRTLLTEPLRLRDADAATPLAAAISLLWTVHPLQTQSVTYIVQRAESLMGLCYLFTLYALARSATAPSPRRWHAAAVIACSLGMASKPPMVTAPLLAFLYDRTFLGGSWRAAWRARRGVHVGLASTWALPAALLALHDDDLRRWNVGFELPNLSPLDYALAQPGILLHYLRLAAWPSPLVLDYSDWPLARTPEAIVLPAIVIGGFLLATCWSLRHRPSLGFLGAWCLGILAPTSSVIPIAELVEEHRMYLPLAAIIACAVLAGYELLVRRVAPGRLRRGVALAVVLGLAGGFGMGTVSRNAQYQSGVAFWEANVLARPRNARARTYLAAALAEQGELPEAIARFEEALRLRPDFEEAHNAFGNALIRQERRDEAIAHYREAIRLKPDYAAAYNNLGAALLHQGAVAQAIDHLTKALRLKPAYAAAHNNLGNALILNGEPHEAIAHYRQALRIKPDYGAASRNLAQALRQGPTAAATEPRTEPHEVSLDK